MFVLSLFFAVCSAVTAVIVRTNDATHFKTLDGFHMRLLRNIWSEGHYQRLTSASQKASIVKSDSPGHELGMASAVLSGFLHSGSLALRKQYGVPPTSSGWW